MRNRHAGCLAGAISVLAALAVGKVVAGDLTALQLPSMNVQHFNGGSVAWNSRLYVWGGVNSAGAMGQQLEIYNPEANAWSWGASLPMQSQGMGEFLLDGRIYSVGGEGPPASFHNNVYRYDPNTDAWAALNPFPRNTWDTEFVVCDGKAYSFGGRTGYGGTYGDCWQYSPAGDTWTREANMLTSVMLAGHAAFGGKIYVFGGTHKTSESQSQSIREIQVYDPSLNGWQDGNDMPWLLGDIRAAVCGEAIWLFAGSRYDDAQGKWVANECAYEYRPATDEWLTHGLGIPSRYPRANEAPVIDGWAYLTNLLTASGDLHTSEAYRVAVPEPATLALLALGGLAMIRRRR